MQLQSLVFWVGGEQPTPQDDSGFGSAPGQEPLEKDLGGDAWPGEQGSGNEGERLLTPASRRLSQAINTPRALQC